VPRNTYRLKDNTIVPGVTTIIGQLDKPQLVDWAWKLGKEGKDWREQRDSAGDIGTQVHEAVLASLRGEVDIKFTGDFAHQALSCYEKFIDWWFDMAAPLIVTMESPFVSEKLSFGGQPDLLYLTNNSKFVLCDIKTSGGIYESHWLQLAGYAILLEENGYKVDEYQILWLPKDNRFDDPIRTDLRKEKRIFKHLLGIYYDRRA
jgi:hypothetical protein